MADLPAPIRRLQQNPWVVWLAAPASIIGGPAVVKVWECMSHDVSKFSLACVVVGANTSVSLALGWLARSFWGHSPGSSDFDIAGKPTAAPELKKLADAAVTVQKRADDTSDIKVEPEQAIAAANIVSQIADDVKVAANIVQKTASV